MSIPQPEFCIEIQRAAIDGSDALLQLPTRPGVFAFIDADGHTICLAVTANLRRLVRSRLEPIDHDAQPTRRVDYHQLTHTVRALPVGSPFEADWAYLQLARRYVPSAVKAITDRWVGWWVHVNPAADFPRFAKTARPGKAPTGTSGVYLGPIGDKHAAARFIDTLQAGFDLCRYYHILIESPNATACAYKEMGRCPAPCDGTVSMAHYHDQIRDAVTFAADRQTWIDALQQRMQQLSEAMDFEAAQRAKPQLDDLAPAMKPAFAHVDRLESFRWLAVCPGESKNTCRVFLINSGWIAPLADVPMDCDNDELQRVADCINVIAAAHTYTFGDEELENIGLVCAHLLRPKNAQKAPVVFVRFGERVDAEELQNAIGKLHRQLSKSTAENDSDSVTEQVIDSL